MAFNTSDTRQRAFVPIDTSNPGGAWMEEKSYNKSRPGDCKKVLCGNWQEERLLEGDMMSQGMEVTVTRKDGNRVRGGFESSPYLTMAADPRDRRQELLSTHRASYNMINSNVDSQKKSALGVRSQAKFEQVASLAKDSLAAAQEERERTMRMDKTSGNLADENPYTSTYQGVHCPGGIGPRKTVDRIPTEYLDDTPITLYTGHKGATKVMAVHGKTATSSFGSTHSRHTHFSEEKYSIGNL